MEGRAVIDKSPAEVTLGLRIHAIVFAAGIIAVIVINYFTGPPWWFWWVLLGWGIGLACHWYFTRGMRKG